MKIIEKFAINNPCYKNNIPFKNSKPIGMIVHSVGVSQPDPLVFVKNHSVVTSQVVPHGFMGEDGTMYQLLRFNQKGWHGGSGIKGSVNDTHIGIETTEPKGIKYNSTGTAFSITDETAVKSFVSNMFKQTVELAAYLCKMFDWDPLDDGILLSHNEAGKRKIASGHVDPDHIWDRYGFTMDKFRQEVYNILNPKTTGKMYGVMKQVIALSDEGKAKQYAQQMQKEDPDSYWFVMEK